MELKKPELWLAIALVVYLLVVGLGAVLIVIVNFPVESMTEKGIAIQFTEVEDNRLKLFLFGAPGSTDRGFLLLAFFAGIAGSFLHAAQSLSSYFGNATFKASWTAWYFLRPWIGGVLGFATYFALRAGLIAGTTGINPLGWLHSDYWVGGFPRRPRTNYKKFSTPCSKLMRTANVAIN